MKDQTKLVRFFGASCAVACMSAATVYVVLKALYRSDISPLMTQVPVALAAGLVAGLVYCFVMRRLLPAAGGRNSQELSRGLMWFNWSVLGIFALLLPVEAQYSNFVVGLVLAAGCARLIGAIYTVFGASLSNRRRFAGNFVMLAVTTMMVISVVKSSLALSLGLVGALSIVRFRTAVKEPEELAFLFFTIAIGLGFGAARFDYTLIGFWTVSLGYIAFRRLTPAQKMDNAYLLSFWGSGDTNAGDFEAFMQKELGEYELTRFERSGESLHVSLLAELESVAVCAGFGERFKAQFPDMDMNIVQTRGLS
ncbi:protein of unknown function [Desulfobaculum bizertense DSM 18034]|uniref:DUF4956 domain-containing protein n=2 Tax=Desulfobaculum TaxID=1433996 RepID=A0A1T4WKP0_9BACT|nr:protein of unknown function [Desulfobaculum bizertense DSM 18034]